MPKPKLASLFPLFLVLFIDGMGLGLLFPILNTILLEPQAGFLPGQLSVSLRATYYGFTVGIFMICWFFGAAILGDLSDNIGRKRALLICLIGSFLGYFVSALGIIGHSLPVLIAGRIVAGFTAGSQPIAQAAIVDVSSESEKARNIGLILLSVSLGFVFGPIFGGILSDPKLVSWFSFETPMYFASGLSLLNAFLLYWFFQETYKTTAIKKKIRWQHAIDIFISAFKHPAIRFYSLVFLIMIFGWSNYFTFISVFLTQTYHYTIMQNSLFLALLGVGFSLGCGYLVNYCTKWFNFESIVIVSLLVTGIAVLITLLVPQQWVAWVAAFFIGCSISVSWSVLLTLFSNQVSDKEQGWVMGVTGSISALCFGLTSIFTGSMVQVGAGLPMTLSILGLMVSAALLRFIKAKQENIGS